MRSHCTAWLPVAGLIALAGCGPGAMTDADRATIEDQLIQMGNDWSRAYESSDLSALDRIFADDFIYSVNDGTLYGKEAFISLAEEDPIVYDSVRIEDREIRWYGNTAVVTGVGANFWTDGDGAVQRDAGRFTNVFVERDGQWQVVVGHSSPVLGLQPAIGAPLT